MHFQQILDLLKHDRYATDHAKESGLTPERFITSDDGRDFLGVALTPLYLSSDGMLRIKCDQGSERMTVLQAYDRFGLNDLEGRYIVLDA